MAPREPVRTQARRFNFYVVHNVTVVFRFTKGQAVESRRKILNARMKFEPTARPRAFAGGESP
jgi:hypothetical protein